MSLIALIALAVGALLLFVAFGYAMADSPSVNDQGVAPAWAGIILVAAGVLLLAIRFGMFIAAHAGGS